MCRIEYSSLVKIVPKSNKEPAGSNTKAGQKASRRFPFDANHDLHASHEQVLLSKQKTPILTGSKPPPKYPGARDETVDDIREWEKCAETFAKYYLTAYKPGVGDEDDSTPLTWDALCDWVNEHCSQQEGHGLIG